MNSGLPSRKQDIKCSSMWGKQAERNEVGTNVRSCKCSTDAASLGNGLFHVTTFPDN